MVSQEDAGQMNDCSWRVVCRMAVLSSTRGLLVYCPGPS